MLLPLWLLVGVLVLPVCRISCRGSFCPLISVEMAEASSGLAKLKRIISRLFRIASCISCGSLRAVSGPAV